MLKNLYSHACANIGLELSRHVFSSVFANSEMGMKIEIFKTLCRGILFKRGVRKKPDLQDKHCVSRDRPDKLGSAVSATDTESLKAKNTILLCLKKITLKKKNHASSWHKENSYETWHSMHSITLPVKCLITEVWQSNWMLSVWLHIFLFCQPSIM